MEDFECIELNVVEEISVVKFKDQKVMDPSRIETMGKELLSLVDDAEDADNVLINFENVSFFSSAAINKLIVLEKRIRARGGAIRLSNLRPEVRDLFSYTNLDSMFQIRGRPVRSAGVVQRLSCVSYHLPSSFTLVNQS